MNNRLLFLTFSLLIFFLSLGEGNKEVETKLKQQNTILTKNEDQILLRDARETRRKKREKRKRKARKSKQKKKGKNKKNNKRRSNVKKSKQRLKKSTNKKTRKNKSMRKKEKRRTRRLKKTQRKKGQKARKARKCGRQNTIDETCLTNLVNSISFERDQVTNFLAQYNRIKNFAKLVGNKAAKKGDFSNSSSTLLEALGGNGSNPACAGQRMTRGSRNAAVDSYKKLSNCSNTIETSCLIPNGTYLPDVLDTCNATYQEIKTKNKQCTTKTTNQDNACACWAEALTLVSKAKNSTCDAKKPSDSVRKLKVACINTFSGCKKAEDASIGYIVTCRTCNSSAGECDLTTAGAGGAATTEPPPLSATAPAATTAATGALKAVALLGGVNNEDKAAAGVAVVGEDAANCSLPNMQENPTQHASDIFKDHIVLCGGEVNKQISSKCLKMSMGSSPAWTAAPTLEQPVKHTAMAVLADKLMLLGGQTQAIRGMPLTQEEFKGDRSASEPIHVEEMKCGPEQTKRIISVTEANRWPNGVVPYEISGTFDADERTVIAEGLQNIMDNTCVVWRAKTASDKDWVNIVNEEDGCFADLGFQGPEYGAHVLNIKGFGCMWKSTVIHEAGHNLGLQHEHNRPDRDNYWTVNWLNVKVDKAFSYFRAAWATEDVDNLKKCDDTGLTQPTDFSDCIAPYSSNTVTDFNVGYDFYSIMHYTPVVTDAAFVIDDSVPIMTIKDSSVCDTDCVNNIGQGTELTSKDIEKIKKAYNCKASATTEAPSAATTASATTAPPSSDSPVSKQIWILSSLTGAWSKGGSLSTARYGHCAVTFNNEVVVTGGSSGGTTVLKSVEAITAAGAGTAIPDMNQGRMYHGCTVAGGSIIVAGGIGALNGKGLDSVEKFSSGQWESLTGLGGGRYSFPMLTINDKAFIFGGTSGSGAATDNILTLNDKSWDVYCDKSKPECKGIDRHGHTAANVQNIC